MSLHSLHNAGQGSVKKSKVFLYSAGDTTSDHELAVHEAIGYQIAALLDCAYSGVWCSPALGDHSCYYIPSDTLVGSQESLWQGMCVGDFFGGWVPARWTATKVLSHPLWHESTSAPEGWSAAFMEKAEKAVLNGYSAFTLKDAFSAGTELLKHGTVRIKPAEAKAGRGQAVVDNVSALKAALENLPMNAIEKCGVVVEEHLSGVVTYSVGQIDIAGFTASYVGTQTLTSDNTGEQVYGGSDLLMVRGGYQRLLEENLSSALKVAVAQARCYEEAAFAAYPELLLSRRNYDIAQGRNARGELVSGVLEQSWRIGGASSAEIFGLAEMCRNPHLNKVRSASMEFYGKDVLLPEDAVVLYQGHDKEVGDITKCVRVFSNE